MDETQRSDPEPDLRTADAVASDVLASDVVIVGAGLAGLTLSRHLLLYTDKTVTLVEKRDRVPGRHQKVGESTVQVGGYYYSKVLDMEEYLHQKHYMKYNLRFYWRPAGHPGTRFEDYSQAYIRTFSNVVSYQLDRNTFEAEVLRRNLESPRFRFVPSAKVEEVVLDPAGPHRLRVRTPDGVTTFEATWAVDTTGRGKLLEKRLGLAKPNPIRHAAFYWWVEGLVDIDRLTDASTTERLRKPQRRRQGHAPIWLATNHFCSEGLWFWVIPLQGRTSLGLVFEKRVLNHRDVFTVEKATAWVLEHFPLFARDLPHRKVLDFGGLKDFSYDCRQTISPERWALAGEAGRFTDPLYSPGSDLISIYNTLIVDAITTDDRALLEEKCRLHENVMRAVYKAYEPTYEISYDTLGDPEAFSLKYLWELTVYFATFVFPFLNGFLTDRRFVLPYLRGLTRLGPLNGSLQKLLSAFFHWKKAQGMAESATVLFDFTDMEPLRRAERAFYEIGIPVEEGRQVLHRQLDYLEELARLIVAHVASVLVGDPRLRDDHAFVSRIDLAAIAFDPEATRKLWEEVGGREGRWTWTFDPSPLDRLEPSRHGTAAPAAEAVGAGYG